MINKYHLLVFATMQLLFSCIQKKIIDNKKILNEKSNTYHLIVEETGTKKDALGKVECQYYAQSLENPDSLGIYGFRLKQLIAYLSNTEEKDIVIEKEGFQNIFLNVYYRNLSERRSIDKKFILNKLQQLYHFNVKSDSMLATVYNLVVADYAQLQQGRLPYSSSNSIEVAGDGLSITSQHISIPTLAKTLNQQLAQHITTTISDTSKYAFKLKLSPFSNLQNELIRQYGLKLEETRLFIPVFYVTP